MLMRASSHTEIALSTLSEGGWWTIDELALLAGCSRELMRHVVQWIANDQIVFRRKRQAKWKPFEYRCFPRAVNVQAS